MAVDITRMSSAEMRSSGVSNSTGRAASTLRMTFACRKYRKLGAPALCSSMKFVFIAMRSPLSFAVVVFTPVDLPSFATLRTSFVRASCVNLARRFSFSAAHDAPT